MTGRTIPWWFQAPANPPAGDALRIDARTTPRRLVARVVASVPRYAVPAAALSVVHQVGEALVPVLMGLAIDRAIATGDPAQLALWLAALAADFAVLSFSYRFGSRIGQIGLSIAEHRLRRRVVDRLLARSSDACPPGTAVTLAISDVGRVAEAVALIVFPVGQVAAIVFSAAALLALAWPIGLAVLVGAPAVLWLSDRMSTPLHRRSLLEQEAAADAAAQAADILNGYRVVRGLGAESAAVERYRRASRGALRGALRARRSEGLFLAGTGALSGLFVVAIGIAAALAAAAGSLTVGAFIAVVGLTQFLLSPLETVAQQFGTTWASATASAERLLELLRSAPEAATVDQAGGPVAGTVGGPVDGALEVRELQAPGLDRIDLRVAVGRLVAVDAPPAAAAALADVLTGNVEPSAGCVRLGEHVLARAGRPPLGPPLPGVLVAPHGAHLFSGSVMDNVRVDGVSRDRAMAALSAAGCDDLVTCLPDGYDSQVGERGGRLSGGQRQRVALARALAAPTSTLVLHEPTTAVDAVTEALIGRRLPGSGAGRRTVVIARSGALQSGAQLVVPAGDQASASTA